MARKMSLMKLKEFNEKIAPTKYFFLLENQKRSDLDFRMDFSLTFDELEAICGPDYNGIILRSKDRSSYFRFYGVENVVVEKCDIINGRLSWATYKFVQDTLLHKGTYTVIAQ